MVPLRRRFWTWATICLPRSAQTAGPRRSTRRSRTCRSSCAARSTRGRRPSAARQPASEALAATAEIELEGYVRDIESDLLSAVDKQRKVDPYAACFPNNLTGALKPRGNAQADEAARILALVGKLQGVPEHTHSRVSATTRAIDTLRTRVASADTAEAAVSAALTSERMAQRAWRDQYRKTHGLLTALYPRDKRKVEGFFKKVRKRR